MASSGAQALKALHELVLYIWPPVLQPPKLLYLPPSQYPSTQRFKYYSPPLRSKDFKQPVGDFAMSVFVPGSAQALTATADGDLVVWDEQGITAQMGTRATDRRASKLMRIHNSAITVLTTIGDYIVSGRGQGGSWTEGGDCSRGGLGGV